MQQPPTCAPWMVLGAYRRGIFPMASGRDGQIRWFQPDPRAILPLDERFHVPHNLARRVRSGRFRITRDQAFDRVIHQCAEPRSTADDTWINGDIIDTYRQLHRQGHAHSIEAWNHDDALVGGLYGVTIGGAFFGESMFSRATDASKVCLVHLVEHLRHRGFTLLDAQLPNEHLTQFGLIEIPLVDFLLQLNEAMRLDVTW